MSKLESATRETQKGEYHKTAHGPDLLRSISPEKVRKLKHAERLLTFLEAA
jgi:hypothetical protein